MIESGWYIFGKQVNKFEEDFADYLNVKQCIGVANGLDALTLIFLAYKELGLISDGDEVNTYNTEPNNPDSDYDNISDGEEVFPGLDGFITDPNDDDSDNDLMPDGWEVTKILTQYLMTLWMMRIVIISQMWMNILVILILTTMILTMMLCWMVGKYCTD